MFCPQCGNELWAGDKYCSKCGTPTRQNLEKEPETQIGNVVDKEPTEKTDASVKETDASIKVDQPSRDTSAMESMVTTDVPVDGNTIPLKEPPDPTGKLRLDFPDGSSYFGYTLNGQPHSTGVMWYADNSVYEGEFEYGKRSGVGTLTIQNPFNLSNKNELKRVGDWKNDKLDTRAEITQDKEVNFSENSDRSIQRKEDKTKNRVDSVAWVFAIILLCIAGFLIVRYGGLVGGLSLGVGITVFTATKNRVSSFVAFLSGVVSGLATYGIGSTAFVMMMEKM